jgi:hypothetical protein
MALLEAIQAVKDGMEEGATAPVETGGSEKMRGTAEGDRTQFQDSGENKMIQEESQNGRLGHQEVSG